MTLRRAMSLVTIVAVLWLATARLDAYVDPGIVGALYQAVYALVFGVLAAWILRPWRYLTSRFRRRSPGSAELPTAKDETHDA